MTESAARTSPSSPRRRPTWPLTAVMFVGGILTLGVLALYPVSAYYQFNWFKERPATTTAVSLSQGYLLFCSFKHAPISGAAGGVRTELVARSNMPAVFTGFRWWFRRQDMPQGPAFTVPIWVIGLPAGIATGAAWWRRSRARGTAQRPEAL